jgi:hypothetical protein
MRMCLADRAVTGSHLGFVWPLKGGFSSLGTWSKYHSPGYISTALSSYTPIYSFNWSDLAGAPADLGCIPQIRRAGRHGFVLVDSWWPSQVHDPKGGGANAEIGPRRPKLKWFRTPLFSPRNHERASQTKSRRISRPSQGCLCRPRVQTRSMGSTHIKYNIRAASPTRTRQNIAP